MTYTTLCSLCRMRSAHKKTPKPHPPHTTQNPKMAPKTRAITTEWKEGKRKKKKRTSFTDDLNPFSPLSQPPLQPSLYPYSLTLYQTPPKSPLLLCPAASPPLIPSPSPLPLPPPSTLATRFRTMSSRISSYTNNWPHQNLSPVKLAAAGFYRLISGDGEDTIKCAFCRIQWEGWDNIDYSIRELVEEHKDEY